MNKAELKKALSGRVIKIRLEGLENELSVKPLSAAARSEYFDRLGELAGAENAPTRHQDLTLRNMGYLASKSLVDTGGGRIYADGEECELIEDFNGPLLDQLFAQCLTINGMDKAADPVKNSKPTPSESSS